LLNNSLPTSSRRRSRPEIFLSARFQFSTFSKVISGISLSDPIRTAPAGIPFHSLARAFGLYSVFLARSGVPVKAVQHMPSSELFPDADPNNPIPNVPGIVRYMNLQAFMMILAGQVFIPSIQKAARN
jgi:hypothetical protein